MNIVEQVTDYVKNYDEEVGKAIELELGRQRRNLELIASENIISPAVMMAMATVPANTRCYRQPQRSPETYGTSPDR